MHLSNLCPVFCNTLSLEYHDWLLGPEVDILPCLLLPLAGPEEFDEDDMEKLPADLQYLEPDKRREPLAIVRANLVEALIQVGCLSVCKLISRFLLSSCYQLSFYF